MNGMASDSFVDDAGRLSRRSGHEGQVDFSHGARGKLLRKIAVGRVVFGNDQGAARFLVEAMDDAGTFLAADAGKIFTMGQERVDQSSLLVPGAGMNDQPRGFVEH